MKFLLFWQNIGIIQKIIKNIVQNIRLHRTIGFIGNIGRISEHSTNFLNLLFSENSILSNCLLKYIKLAETQFLVFQNSLMKLIRKSLFILRFLPLHIDTHYTQPCRQQHRSWKNTASWQCPTTKQCKILGVQNFSPQIFHPRHSVQPEIPEFFGPCPKSEKIFWLNINSIT